MSTRNPNEVQSSSPVFEKSRYPWLIGCGFPLTAIVCCGAGYFGFQAVQEVQNLQRDLERLRSTPGVMSLDAENDVTPIPPVTRQVIPPTPTATPTFEAVSPQDLLSELSIQDQADESPLLNTARNPLYRITDQTFTDWSNNVRDLSTDYGSEAVLEQIQLFDIIMNTPREGIHFGLWNPDFDKTNFSTIRLGFGTASTTGLDAQQTHFTQNTVLADHPITGVEQLTFRQNPLDTDFSGFMVESSDGNSRAALRVENVEDIAKAYYYMIMAVLEQEGVPVSQRESTANYLMQRVMVRENFESIDGYSPFTYLNDDSEQENMNVYTFRRRANAASVHLSPDRQTADGDGDRADQVPVVLCEVPFETQDGLTPFGEYDADQAVLVLLVVRPGSEPLEQRLQVLTVMLQSNYEGISQEYEVAPSTDFVEGEGRLTEECGPARPSQPVAQPAQSETQPPYTPPEETPPPPTEPPQTPEPPKNGILNQDNPEGSTIYNEGGNPIIEGEGDGGTGSR